MPPNKPLHRTVNSPVHLTLGAVWRHTGSTSATRSALLPAGECRSVGRPRLGVSEQPLYRELSTRRLLLRQPRQGDAPLIYESFASDPRVTRYLTWKPHEALADAEAALFARLDRLERKLEYSWVLEPCGSAEVVGLVSVWLEAGSAEVGFVLARSWWNQGFATEAVMSVTNWALSSPTVSKVWATCDLENAASARVLEKAGFVRQPAAERQIVRPNLSPEPRASMFFEATRAAAQQGIAPDR